MKIREFLKDIFAPKYCSFCKKEGYFLCQKCMSGLSDFESLCYYCKEKNQYYNTHEKCRKYVYYDKIIILTHYREKHISKLIKDAKFYGKKDVLYDFAFYGVKKIISILGKEYPHFMKEKDQFLMLPTPMGFWRKLKRGYNHSEILASEIASLCNIPFSKHILKKRKSTGQQSKLNQQQRVLNIKDSFKIEKKYRDNIDKKIIILIDDVVSTGSTVNEIAKILKENGAQKVFCFALASD